MAVGADVYGEPIWLEPLPEAQSEGVAWNDEFGVKCGPFEIDEPFATSRRLLVDRYCFWAFRQNAVAQYERSTLERNPLTPVAALSAAETASIVDIAPDGGCGVWCLLAEGGRPALARIDSRGQAAGRLSLPPEIVEATELAMLDRGATLALLAPADRRLFLIDAGTGALKRAVYIAALDGDRPVKRLASDGMGTLALCVGTQQSVWALYLLDRTGEIVQGPLSPEFPKTEGGVVELSDVALGGGRLWIASPQGLWRLEQSDASNSEKSTAELLTPLLHSPTRSGEKGWQQAEIEIDLPEGASIDVSFLATDDPRIADEIRQIAANESLPQKVRMTSIWALLSNDIKAPKPYVATGGPEFSGQVKIPLFTCHEEFLVMRIKIDLPPLVRSPILRRIRIGYPEQSLMRRLPAVFSGPEGDPDGVLRRVVGVVEATSIELDARIASIGRMIEAETAPEDWLDYIGSWLDLPWHDALHPGSKRLLLQNAGELLAWRGTRRGLVLLLECLAGPGAIVEVNDVMADRSAMVLGGGGIPGTPVRGLLAGKRRDAPTLGGRAVVGRTRLGCKDDASKPLDILTPWIGIVVGSAAEYRTRNAPHLAHALAQYLPAGVRHNSQWRLAPAKDLDDPDALILEAREPGTLSRNVEIGRTTLAGRSRTPIGSGIEMGFQLR